VENDIGLYIFKVNQTNKPKKTHPKEKAEEERRMHVSRGKFENSSGATSRTRRLFIFVGLLHCSAARTLPITSTFQIGTGVP